MLKIQDIPLFFLGLFVISNFFRPEYYLDIQYPHLPQVCILCSIVSLLCIKSFAGGIRFYFSKGVILAILLLILITYLTYYSSINIQNSEKTLAIFAKGVVVFILITWVINDYRQFLFFLSVLAGCISLSAYKLTHYPVWDKGRAWLEGSALIKDPNDVTTVLVCGLPIIYGLFMVAKNKIVRLILLYAGFTTLLGVVEARSRGGFLALLCVIALGVALQQSFKRKALITLVILPILLVFTVRYIPSGYIDRIRQIVDIERDETGSAIARKSAMLISSQYIISNPISEYGPGNHSYDLALTMGEEIQDIETQAKGGYLTHSMLLQFGHDNGLVPMLLYICWLLAIIHTLWKVRKLVIGREDRGKEHLVNSLLMLFCCFLVGATFLPFAYRFYVFYFGGVALAGCKAIKSSIDHLEDNETMERTGSL